MRERSPGSDGHAEPTDHTGAWRRRDEIRARFVMPAMDWAAEHLEEIAAAAAGEAVEVESGGEAVSVGISQS